MAGGKFARLKKDGAALHRPRPVPRAAPGPSAPPDTVVEPDGDRTVSAAVGEEYTHMLANRIYR